MDLIKKRHYEVGIFSKKIVNSEEKKRTLNQKYDY